MADNLICRGDWALGTACGECSRCRETALDGARKQMVLIRELRSELARKENEFAPLNEATRAFMLHIAGMPVSDLLTLIKRVQDGA